MRAWSLPSTRCVICQFRALRRSIASTYQSRQYGDIGLRRVPDAPQKLRSIGGKASRLQKRKGEISLLDLQSSRAQRPGDIVLSTSKFARARAEEDELHEQLKKNVQKSLESAESNMLRTGPFQGDHISTLERLDPTGHRWPAFKASINSLLSKPTKLQSDEDKSLLDRLYKALKQSNADLQTQLYFEFLDRCLSSLLKKAPESAYDLRYPTEWYSAARKSQRVIHLHVGPTNSGKTYNALKRLQEKKNGFYAGPLRLLAHEVYSRFRANGIKCDLITGDDVRLDEDGEAEVYASTVEMVNVAKEVEVAVIDEIQMLGNEERGWAWTRAFLGANAKEVHLCGETRVIPLIRELTASMGDTLKVHEYKRLNPLEAQPRSLRGNLKHLQKGDCVVCFSIVGIHALKKQIEVETGRRAAIVYGSLPPETRAAQAELFNDPTNDYDFLVASDAIGMGLNLSVRRIVFETTVKFNGIHLEPLTIPQIKQIAGRAGRYRTARQDKLKDSTSEVENIEPGLVTCLEDEDLALIHAALKAEAPPLRKAMILPPAEYLEEYSLRLPPRTPFEYLFSRVCQTAQTHPRFAISDIRDKLKVARITDLVPNLSIEERAQFAACPVGGRDTRLPTCLRALAQVVADRRAVTIADVPEMPLEILATKPSADQKYLASLEALHQCLTMFLWLSYRFITFFKDQPMAFHAKELTEQRINWTLTAFSANRKLRQKIIATRQKTNKENQPQVHPQPNNTARSSEEAIIDEDQAQPNAGIAVLSEDQKDNAVNQDVVDALVQKMGEEVPLSEDQWDEEGPSDRGGEPRWEERPNDERFITTEEESEIIGQQQMEGLQSGESNDEAQRISKHDIQQPQAHLQGRLDTEDVEQSRAASAGS